MDSVKITITVVYEDRPDPSQLLDEIQDNIQEYLTPNDETVESFNVCVEDVEDE